MCIDRKLLRAAIATVTAEIREMKSRKHESHQPRWKYTDEYTLIKAKHRATILCCISASLRSKLHHMKSMEDQAAFIQGRTQEFERKEEVA